MAKSAIPAPADFPADSKALLILQFGFYITRKLLHYRKN